MLRASYVVWVLKESRIFTYIVDGGGDYLADVNLRLYCNIFTVTFIRISSDRCAPFRWGSSRGTLESYL